MLRNLFKALFASPRAEESSTSTRWNFNRTLIDCPMCHQPFTVHGMKRHWQSAHTAEYHRRQKHWNRWYSVRKAETEGVD
jgi:hypothetical protein